MAKSLVVVESPAKARTINRFLGDDYVVKASNGHVRDLPKRDLGVDIANGFKPTYEQVRGSSKTIRELKEAAGKVDRVLLATDPDREGEAIGWHVAVLLKPAKKPVSRIVFNEITKRAVLEAAKSPRPIDENLVNAQQARRVLDRLVGYKMSPFLQWAVRKGLSAGRVQSVAVRMVCDRETEIRNFVVEEYWTLDALFLTERGETFVARLNRVRGEKAEIANEQDAQKIMRDLEGAQFIVASVDRKEVERRPFPPFITSTLQQEASSKLRFNPRRTMAVAQQLYEGIALGEEEGSAGLITYMRTDSTRLAGEAIEDVRGYIRDEFEPAMLPAQPNFYKSKKGAQDAHEAIRPTQVRRTPERVKAYLDKDQLALYTLIWRRFVACQMAAAILDQMTVDVASDPYEFRAAMSIVKFPGFTKLYEEAIGEKTSGKDSQKPLPVVHENERVSVEEFRPEQHFTKPPPRYTDASLIRALEENGIGRPSTYAPTINTILERGYVVREKRRLSPTELGEQVNALLIENFPDILNVNFTAQLEGELDHVEEGTREWGDLLRVFYTEFEKDLNAAQRRMVAEVVGKDTQCPQCGGGMEVCEGRYGLFLRCSRYPQCKGRVSVKRRTEEPTDVTCRNCGAPMVIRDGRFGRFMACSNYPKCKTTHDIDKEGRKVARPPKVPPKKTDQKCPDCGAFLVIRKSRAGEEFYGCEKYPKCKFTRPLELGLKCLGPGCDGNLVIKRARRGRFVGCDKYPDCDFTAFGQVQKDSPCPKCGNSWTTLVRGRSGPPLRRCPAPECKYEEALPEEA